MVPDAETVEVWRFGGEEAGCERCIDWLPVRLGEVVVGEIDLGEVFPRG